MIVPRTYRVRLIVYVSVLLAFLIGVLVYAYQSSSRLVLNEAENGVARIAQQIEGQLRIEARDLAERTRMMRDNSSFTSYLYIAISLKTDPGAMRDLYRRQFGWMQISRSVVVAQSGQTLIGAEHRDLVKAVKARGLVAAPDDRLFYHESGDGLEMVATTAIGYRSQQLGVIAVTRVLNAEWMRVARQMSGGQLFLVKNGRIVLTSLGNERTGQVFTLRDDRVSIDGEAYLVRRVATADSEATPQLWFGFPQGELTAHLRDQRDRMFGIVVAGCVAVLVIGFLMLRNFSAPLSRLVSDIQELGEGRFPEIRRSAAHDEIGFLTNQFSSMVTSLREKQNEVMRVQAQLERDAITDALTGFYNRRYLYDLFPRLWSEATRTNKLPTLIIVDLDLFKRINDRYGHMAGDQVLLHFARVMREHCRVSDFLFRLGGEEFLVLTSGDIEGGRVLAEKVRAALEREPYVDGEHRIPVTASFGVAQADAADGLDSLSAVLRRADEALYAAKQAGRNRVTVWNSKRQSA